MPLALPCSDPQPLPAGLERTDAFHRQPLFAVDPLPGHPGRALVVRSWNEAHALHGPACPVDVNPAYVAALISDDSRADVAPYWRIRRLPRAHHVLITASGDLHASPYDPLAGGGSAMDAPTLHLFLRQGLVDHVRRALEGHSGPIGCEHSSGLDSNAVLGVLVHGLGLPPERLHTWSDEGSGEGPPLVEFRPFYRLRPDHCHRLQPAVAPHEPALDPDEHPLMQPLRVFGAPAQMGGNPIATTLLRQQGCTLLFSGFGGDQAISHNAANVPTDLVAQGRWIELRRWIGGRRRSLIRAALQRTLALHHRPWAERQVLLRARDFVRSDVLERTLTAEGRAWLGPHLRDLYPWEIDGWLPQHASIRHRVLADWVALRAEDETRLAAAHGMAKAFPLLDERLIATLLHQDPALFGERAGQGRLLHRRGFAPFLPPFLRDNPTKDRQPEGGHEQWEAEIISNCRQALERQLEASRQLHPALSRWWDLAAIRYEAETFASKSEPTLKELCGTSMAIDTLARLSGWWEALDG
jgi:asparagine synthetase B (glutamine-hydrolysing)